MRRDTSVWSLASRRDRPQDSPAVDELVRAHSGSDIVVTTGLILPELLQGFVLDRARAPIIKRFASMPLVQPDRDDYIAAAKVRNTSRKPGVQLGTIDALIAQLAGRGP